MNTDCSNPYRYAVYFAPAPGSSWWEAGSRWLGRCAATHDLLTQPVIDGIPPGLLSRLTAEPRRYGWHATLKAPFSLRRDVRLDHLLTALQALAAGFRSFELPALRVRRLGGFLALCPEGRQDAINAVAGDCVTRLHPLASPLSADELGRRRRKGTLSTREDELMLHWGYPYVLDCYRFHLSLTGPLDGMEADTADRLELAARDWFSALPACRFDSLSLFAEPVPGADFVLVERMDFGA